MLEERLITKDRGIFVDSVAAYMAEGIQTLVSRGQPSNQREVSYGLILGYARGEEDPAIESNPWKPTVSEEILSKQKTPDMVFTHNGVELAVLKESFNLKGVIGVKGVLTKLGGLIVDIGKEIVNRARALDESKWAYVRYEIDEAAWWLTIRVDYLN